MIEDGEVSGLGVHPPKLAVELDHLIEPRVYACRCGLGRNATLRLTVPWVPKRTRKD
jgi:hypothetical protein